MHICATDIPYTILIYSHQVGINGDGQLLTRTLLRLYGGQKNLLEKTPLGKKYDRESG